MKTILSCCIVLGLVTGAARADLVIPSDGSDGDLVIDGDTVIDLSLAASLCDCDDDGKVDDPCQWDCPSPVAGQGVYDAEEWAVVFKYSSVAINSGTVTFSGHPNRAPVVWLVQGDVVIDGIVSLNGFTGTGSEHVLSIPGPGGFRGGRGYGDPANLGSSGLGPGGGDYQIGNVSPGGGSYGSSGQGTSPGVTYGNEAVIPLTGGSGGAGSGNDEQNGAGAGGGAILVAAAATITVDGQIWAVGGSGNTSCCGQHGAGGSGGAIRLIADVVQGTGFLIALGGTSSGVDGGLGRIRIEANQGPNPKVMTIEPQASTTLPADPPQIWPDLTAPTLTATQFTFNGGKKVVPIPGDPAADLDFPNMDVSLPTIGDVTLHIEAYNVPTDWVITVLITPITGVSMEVIADPLVGDESFSTTTATLSVLDLPVGSAAIQLRGDAP